VNAVPLFREGEEKPYRVYTTVEDITEQRIAEKRLKEAVNRSDFYRDLLAHDMGNVLGNINSSLEILEMIDKGVNLSQKRGDIMKILKKAITRGKNLIASVRKLSTIEKKTQAKKKLNIKKVLDKALDHLRSQFQDKVLNISVKMEKNKLFVYAGELLIDAFENILINGVLHNRSEIVKIWISVSKTQENGIDYVKIEFKDNGIGITDKRKKSIFIKNYKKREGSGGMGIGLSLVKKIIDSYEGKIYVENRIKGDYQKGSNFVVFLKKAKAAK
jgi:signal transduction histidine kinase